MSLATRFPTVWKAVSSFVHTHVPFATHAVLEQFACLQAKKHKPCADLYTIRVQNGRISYPAGQRCHLIVYAHDYQVARRHSSTVLN